MDALLFFARFEPLLHYALHVRDVERSASWAQVRNEMHTLAEQERSQSVPQFLTGHMDICRLAVYALVDEILMDSPRMGQESAVDWYQDRLQVRYLRTDRAGELFFITLQKLVGDILQRIGPDTKHAEAAATTQAEHFRAEIFQEQFEHVVLYLLDHIHEGPASTLGPAPASMSASDQQPLGTQAFMLSGDVKVISQAECLCLAIFSLCLLYGFKGLYYGAEHASALERVERVAALLWQGLLPKISLKPQEAQVSVSSEEKSQNSTPWLYFFILTPLILSALWYFICADMVEHMTF